MSATTVLEDLIDVASRLKESVAELHQAYRRLPEIISREEKAIVARDFVEVSAKCAEKEALGSHIEACFSTMVVTGEKLHRLSGRILQEAGERPTCLSQYCALLSQVAAAVGTANFSGQVLQHVVQGVVELEQSFLSLYLEVKPQIEANAYVVHKMLTHFQQSYRFWQEVTEQQAVSYNALGVQQAAGRNHGFKARA